MKTILETTQLSQPNCSYILDLIHNSDSRFGVDIIQIDESSEQSQSIVISTAILSEFINVLENYYAKVRSGAVQEKKHLSPSDKKRIQDNYLKGVDIKDLALQFGQSPELIEMVLRNQGIEIISNKQPRSYYRQSKYYPKRKK